jgi:thiol-disulfide isomerase/thioredoxin
LVAAPKQDRSSLIRFFSGIRPLRLAAAAAVLAVGLGVLWAAGVFASRDQAKLEDGAGSLEPSRTLATVGPDGLETGLREGNIAPDFEFSAFDGRRLKLSDYRGGPVLLNFWATWCIPCRAELPDMENALRRYDGRGLSVIAVNNGEAFKPADRFLQKLEVQLTAFGYDPKQTIVRTYSVYGMPTSYFIDGRGVITRVVTGQLTPAILESGVQEALGASRAH